MINFDTVLSIFGKLITLRLNKIIGNMKLIEVLVSYWDNLKTKDLNHFLFKVLPIKFYRYKLEFFETF